MNINGLGRSYLARYREGEKFIIHVADLIERQLKEWSPEYEVFLMKFSDYELIIKNKDQYYHAKIAEKELESLQKSGPYALDRRVWSELQNQGLAIKMGYGNYMEAVLCGCEIPLNQKT